MGARAFDVDARPPGWDPMLLRREVALRGVEGASLCGERAAAGWRTRDHAAARVAHDASFSISGGNAAANFSHSSVGIVNETRTNFEPHFFERYPPARRWIR